MSNPDSFIDEVTEEVRRDRLFAMFRKYGWVAGLIVAAIVGGAAYNEYRLAQSAASARAFGDGLIDAADLVGAPRSAALAALPAQGGQAALKALVLGAEAEPETALAALAALEADASAPQELRDLATLRRTALDTGADIATRRTALEAISGRAFGILAREQLAYLLLEEGKTDAAIAALSALLQDQAAPAGLRARASQAIISLGGTPPETAAG